MTKKTLLIIGLGNPEKKYFQTRHNAGFILLDELRKKWNLPTFSARKKFIAEISEGNIIHHLPTTLCLLTKPQTFMNFSGEAVKKIIDYYKLGTENIIVIHDDLDIEIGKWKISYGSSSGGHNGVQNIIDNLGTQNFFRIRIGVEKEGGREKRGLISGEKFVLENLTTEELEKIKKLADPIAEKIEEKIKKTD